MHALASTIEELHASQTCHGDLHLGNLRCRRDEIFLLDLQDARPQRSPLSRLKDCAQLEFSLAKAGWDVAARASLRSQLDCETDFDHAYRSFLRDHLRGRARRVLRVGRNWSALQIGPLRGLRDTMVDNQDLKTLFDSAEQDIDSTMRRGGRTRITEVNVSGRIVLVKRSDSAGWIRALGDSLRGSPAARAFRAGQRDLVCSRTASLAPSRTWKSAASVFPREAGSSSKRSGVRISIIWFRAGRKSKARWLARWGDWVAENHAAGLSHRDLKGGNIRLDIGPDQIRFWLVDLEDLRGPSELSDDARLHALSQFERLACG